MGDSHLVSRIFQFLKRYTAASILAAAFVVALAVIMSRPESQQRPSQERSVVVDTIPAARGTFRPALELFGRVESSQDAELRSAVEADVITVHVKDGEKVDQGGLLVSLDGRDARLELLQRDADVKDFQARVRLEQRRIARNEEAIEREQELLELAKRNAERADALFDDKLLSKSDLDTTAENLKRQELALAQRELALEESEIGLIQLQAQLARAKAQRDQAKLKLERTEIKAPFAGIVSELGVSVGDRVNPSEVMMRLHDPVSLEIRAQIPSRYVGMVRGGLSDSDLEMPATVEVDDRTFAGRLNRLAGQTREGSGGVDSFISLVGEDASDIRLGSTVRLTVELPPQDQAVAIPAEAIYGNDRLFKVVDGRMKMVAVERVGELIERSGSSRVLVRSTALRDSDEIIVTKVSNAVDGLLVRSANEADPSGRVARQEP